MTTYQITLRDRETQPSLVTITAPGRRTGAALSPSISVMRQKLTPLGCEINVRATLTSSKSRRWLPTIST